MREARISGNVRNVAIAALLALLTSCTTTPVIAPDIAALPLLDAGEKTALSSWLSQNPDLRLANAGDCDCADPVSDIRSGRAGAPALSAYDPDLAVGDFNGDGQQDFAILVAGQRDAKAATLAIFNGPFDGKPRPPAFVLKGETLAHIGLFQTVKDHKLLVGHFESEGCVYEPKAGSYVERCDF
jgi:hypothetical protein